VLGVRHRAVQQLADDDGGVALGELQDLVGGADVLAADEVEHDARLGGRHAHVAHDGTRAGALVGLARRRDGPTSTSGRLRKLRRHHRLPFADFSWPAW
jgi:hypothetical protein